MREHRHDHAQVVLPLAGTIRISGEEWTAEVVPGQMAYIRPGEQHSFSADERARFLVADRDDGPEEASRAPTSHISEPMSAFCRFAELQLADTTDQEMRQQMARLFDLLMAREDATLRLDPRIARAVERLQRDLRVTPSLADLARVAHLSVSQFKARFRAETGLGTTAFLTRARMQRARALLVNTDTPIALIAEAVGYHDPSAFSRRFTRFFGQPPTTYAGR